MSSCYPHIRPRISLEALRANAQTPRPLLETLEQAEPSLSLGVNIAVMWQLAMRSLYTSADVPVIATRETLQNSVDSIRAAIKEKLIAKDAGAFHVTWDGRSLVWSDNGVGMSLDTIRTRFLVLGESGKRGDGSAHENAGGFGIAKAVILGASESFRWNLRSRDKEVISKGIEKPIEVENLFEFRQGVTLMVHDVHAKYWDYQSRYDEPARPLLDRLRTLLEANYLPDVRLYLNDELIVPRFSVRRGTRLTVNGTWGERTTAQVKAYKREESGGRYWVRLNGLLQYDLAGYSTLLSDIVLDIYTSVRPGDVGYPFNAGRDMLVGVARLTFQAMMQEIERENLSIRDSEEDIEKFEPEGELESNVANELSALLQDGELSRLLNMDEADRSVQSVQDAERAIVHVTLDSFPDQHVFDFTNSPNQIPLYPKSIQSVDVVRVIIGLGAGSDEQVHPEVRAAFAAAEQGKMTGLQLKILTNAIVSRSPMPAKVTVTTPSKVQNKSGNPFGGMAALRINRKQVDLEKVRAFKRSPKRYLPHLLLWDMTLKLIKQHGNMEHVRIYPGFVLQDGTIGLAERKAFGQPALIYVNPFRLMDVIERNWKQPLAIVGFLHGVACHELTHANGMMGEGHNEEFIAAREDLGFRTARILPRLAELASKLLKLPPAENSLVVKIRALEAQLAQQEKQLKRAEESREALKQDKRETVRQLKQELSVARAQARALASTASAQTRAECTSASQKVPDLPVVIDATRTSGPEFSLEAQHLFRLVASTVVQAPPVGVNPPTLQRFLSRHQSRFMEVIERNLTPELRSRLRALPSTHQQEAA